MNLSNHNNTEKRTKLKDSQYLASGHVIKNVILASESIRQINGKEERKQKNSYGKNECLHLFHTIQRISQRCKIKLRLQFKITMFLRRKQKSIYDKGQATLLRAQKTITTGDCQIRFHQN